jgi:RNA polymerase sigma factor (sigma-70 family)
VGSQSGSFPSTRYSVVLAAQSPDAGTRSRAIESVTVAYWRPVYKYVRMKWNMPADDAADFTQEFFTRLLEREFLDSYDSSKGRLRTFLRTCADRLFLNQQRDSARQKRGGDSPHLSLDFEQAEQELALASTAESPEDRFDKEWVRSLFTLALERLREHCRSTGKMVHFQLFERYDLDDEDSKPSYAQLADEFDLATTDVTNHLAFARREFRRCVLDQLRDMTATEDEFRREARDLLGVSL